MRYLALLTAGVTVTLSACSLNSIVNVDGPEGGEELDRGRLVTHQTALGLYHSAIGQLSKGMSSVSIGVGMFTDELTSRPASSPEGGAGGGVEVDARIQSRPSGQIGLLYPNQRLFSHGAPYSFYTSLQAARTSSLQAREILRRLDNRDWDYLVSASYALEAYAVLTLAENLCSGFPLSVVPFEGRVSLDSGVTTEDALRRAVVLFDSSLAILHDSSRFVSLARIGRGRAYLGLGHFDSAALAVEEVPVDYTFSLTYTDNLRPGQTGTQDAFWTTTSSLTAALVNRLEMSNEEGINGLVWYNSDPSLQDPRIPVKHDVSANLPVVRQQKFVNGSLSFPLAASVEATLIRAEYLLDRGDPAWINSINDARHTVGLADTLDPGSPEGRRNLLFRERAYWFYLQGVRLADYRRLVRQYGELPSNVYPRGNYRKSRGETPFYGTVMVFTPPSSELQENYLYQGCTHPNP